MRTTPIFYATDKLVIYGVNDPIECPANKKIGNCWILSQGKFKLLKNTEKEHHKLTQKHLLNPVSIHNLLPDKNV